MENNFFDFYDVPDNINKKQMSLILKDARSKCPDALVVLRHTAGTDFPPFIMIESPKYHAELNKNGTYELVMVLPF